MKRTDLAVTILTVVIGALGLDYLVRTLSRTDERREILFTK